MMNRLVSMNPERADFYAVRAGMEHQRRLYEQAEYDFERAISLDPKNPEYYISRAMFYKDFKKKAKAEADLKSALALGADPELVAGLLHQWSRE